MTTSRKYHLSWRTKLRSLDALFGHKDDYIQLLLESKDDHQRAVDVAKAVEETNRLNPRREKGEET